MTKRGKSHKKIEEKVAEFPVFLEYDLEYQGFVADCPTLPGCMSQGKTKAEALENIKDAISGYLEVLRKHQRTTLPVEDIGWYKVKVAM